MWIIWAINSVLRRMPVYTIVYTSVNAFVWIFVWTIFRWQARWAGQIWCRGDEGWRKSRAGVLRPDSYQRRLDSNDDGGQILLNTVVLKIPWLHNYLAPGKIALHGKYRSNKHWSNRHFINSSWQVGKSAYFGVRKWKKVDSLNYWVVALVRPSPAFWNLLMTVGNVVASGPPD